MDTLGTTGGQALPPALICGRLQTRRPAGTSVTISGTWPLDKRRLRGVDKGEGTRVGPRVKSLPLHCGAMAHAATAPRNPAGRPGSICSPGPGPFPATAGTCCHIMAGDRGWEQPGLPGVGASLVLWEGQFQAGLCRCPRSSSALPVRCCHKRALHRAPALPSAFLSVSAAQNHTCA